MGIRAEWTLKGKVIPLPSGGTVEITDDKWVGMGEGATFRRLTYVNGSCEIVFEVHDGVPGAVSVTLRADQGFLRQKDLAAIRLDQIRPEVYSVAGVAAFTTDGVDDEGMDDYVDNPMTRADARKAVSRAASRTKITPEFLRRVAEIYRAAPDGARIEAVKAAFGKEERQAWRYVAQARQRGFIDGDD